jgi:hypothetical protein
MKLFGEVSICNRGIYFEHPHVWRSTVIGIVKSPVDF